ncbi:MAG TPA: VWA domain-containing protein [Kofleriaceae bacterium]|nr:VWA domain-containing protein [Kofleriaceae bacterium]
MRDIFGNLGWALAAAITLVAVTLVYALEFTRRRRLLDRIGYSPMLQRMMASLSPRRRVVKAVLFTVGATAVLVALAHPLGSGEKRWRQRGIDIALVMDYSKSMLAKDVYPTRLERMEREVSDLTDRLKSDRIAPVVFAGAAAHFPLTHDHEAARALYGSITPADLPPGSDLGEALLTARCLLRPDVAEGACARVGGRGRGGDPLSAEPGWGSGRERPESARPAAKSGEADDQDRARAIVLFTDGEDTEQGARAQVQEAVRLGIDVYVIGVGTQAGELVPEVDENGQVNGWKKLPDGSFVTTRLDQAKLRELAQLAGGEGHYFVLDSKTRGLEGLVARLQRLKEGNLDERVLETAEEMFQWVLFPAFLLLLIEACLADRRRKVPL